jgi:hypothetical protein
MMKKQNMLFFIFLCCLSACLLWLNAAAPATDTRELWTAPL